MKRYTARATFENGTTHEEDFETYDAMCLWLAQYPQAGIAAYDNHAGYPVDQLWLATDVKERIHGST